MVFPETYLNPRNNKQERDLVERITGLAQRENKLRRESGIEETRFWP